MADHRTLIIHLCDELDRYRRMLLDDRQITHPLADRARAALAADGPAVPMPVSERLPGRKDCDAEGRCWLFSKVEKEWRLVSSQNPGVPHLKYCFSHWLPANALPLPSREVEHG